MGCGVWVGSPAEQERTRAPPGPRCTLSTLSYTLFTSSTQFVLGTCRRAPPSTTCPRSPTPGLHPAGAWDSPVRHPTHTLSTLSQPCSHRREIGIESTVHFTVIYDSTFLYSSARRFSANYSATIRWLSRPTSSAWGSPRTSVTAERSGGASSTSSLEVTHWSVPESSCTLTHLEED